MMPAKASIRSVTVVLPASTWARIPTFRRWERRWISRDVGEFLLLLEAGVEVLDLVAWSFVDVEEECHLDDKHDDDDVTRRWYLSHLFRKCRLVPKVVVVP
mmetsp:Transcript_29678/g.43803  ORF Transcript_29678/g.43803 Transcript_29678/m.43803 type:complete len:101 (+) Transcript_29678:160-462(+)